MEDIYVTICDDEVKWRKDIKCLCKKYALENELNILIREYDSGQELIDNCSEKCDILFLDVEMKEVDGLEVKNKLQAEKKNIRIVFITSHFEIVQEAFGRNVYGFLTKPIDKELFDSKLSAMIGYILEERKTIMLDNYGKCKLIYLKDIVYIAAEGKYSKIYTIMDEDYSFSDKSIGFWKQYLADSGFEMSMRSIIINLLYVSRIGHTEVIMKDGKNLDLSRRMKKDFIIKYKDYLWKQGY